MFKLTIFFFSIHFRINWLGPETPTPIKDAIFFGIPMGCYAGVMIFVLMSLLDHIEVAHRR